MLAIVAKRTICKQSGVLTDGVEMQNKAEDELTAMIRSEERERAALTPADYAAAGVATPDWINDPVPSLETWRAWKTAQDTALAHKRAQARRTEP